MDECYEAAKHKGFKTDECKTFWEQTTSDPTAAFTLGIFIFNIVLGLSTIALWQVTRRSADIAERAFSDLERPYIYIFGAKGLECDFDQEEPRDFLKYWVANYGKTPASLESVTLKISVGKSPGILETLASWHDLVARPILTPNERRDVLREIVPEGIPTSQYADEYTPPGSFTVPDLEDGTNFFFWIKIKYRGPFSAAHETSACWQWDRETCRLILFGGERYNYTR